MARPQVSPPADVTHSGVLGLLLRLLPLSHLETSALQVGPVSSEACGASKKEIVIVGPLLPCVHSDPGSLPLLLS